MVPHLLKNPGQERPPELRQMGDLVGKMLADTMTAYATNDTDLAREIASRDDAVDALYAQVFNKILAQMANAGTAERVIPGVERGWLMDQRRDWVRPVADLWGDGPLVILSARSHESRSAP